jgi:hypothetical protein
MRGLLLVALAIAAISAPASAQSSQGTRRVELPSGVAAARVPCAEGKIKRNHDANRSIVMCAQDGLGYAMVEGGFPIKDAWGLDYDVVLADARADTSSGTVKEARFVGLRSFTVESLPTEPVGFARIVEMSPGKLVALVAHEEPAGALSAATAPDARVRARAFADTLEITLGVSAQ